MEPKEYPTASTELDADVLAVPTVIVLGNAAALTRGSDQTGTESKAHPYD
ncbi:hypothetical protein ACFCV8_17285 [Streptomyces sp. NPDC056347]